MTNEGDWLEELLFVVVEMAQMKRVVLFTLWTGSRFERESSLVQTAGEFLSRIRQICFRPPFYLVNLRFVSPKLLPSDLSRRREK